MAGPIPPYALFVLANDIATDYINDALTRAWNGNFQAGWDQWLATSNHADAPQKQASRAYPEGTQAPVPGDFASPWKGRSLEECAQWLRDAPENVALNREYFLAMDQFSRADDTVLICRVVDSADGGGVEVEYFPEETGGSTIQIATSLGIKFDEALQRYQRNRMKDGRPDRSRGTPYRRSQG